MGFIISGSCLPGFCISFSLSCLFISGIVTSVLLDIIKIVHLYVSIIYIYYSFAKPCLFLPLLRCYWDLCFPVSTLTLYVFC
ncbi:hypothetical protein CPC08DRAFT_483837 [Agrocybe pediades]|nr:hypothetical protein CPC08DRAFT_483837 [Agrocybe pediades]